MYLIVFRLAQEPRNSGFQVVCNVLYTSASVFATKMCMASMEMHLVDVNFISVVFSISHNSEYLTKKHIEWNRLDL
jgi:hypothetical protein